MGILDGLRGGFEKQEQKGDAALARERPLEAMRCYADALHKTESRDARADAERLQGKLKAARRAFLEGKLNEARTLAGDELLEDAVEAVEVARQNLTPDDEDWARRIERLDQELHAQLDARAAGGPASELALAESASLPPDATGHSARARADDEEEDGEILELPQDDESGEVAFEQFLGVLPEEDRDRAAQASREFKLGYVAHQMGDHAAAVSWLERARAAAPEDALVLEHLALAQDQVGRTDDARETYRRALALEPHRYNARIALASILAGVRTSGGIQPFAVWRQANAEASQIGADPEPGLALLEEGLRGNDPRAGAFIVAAAELCLATGRPREAMAHVDRVIGQSGGHAAMLWHMRAVGLELDGHVAEAQAAYEQAVLLGGQALFFRSEFAEFALRHRQGLEQAERHIFDTCMSCQATQPGEEELDYYGFLLTRLQHARGKLQEALKGIDRLLAKGPPMGLDGPLRELRRQVSAEIRAAGQRDQGEEDEGESDADASREPRES
jgi:tetratricopeptide (TPR) repeat protein